jgi:hypothetical protein
LIEFLVLLGQDLLEPLHLGVKYEKFLLLRLKPSILCM